MNVLDEYADEFARLSALLEAGLTTLKAAAGAYATAEADYRKAKAAAWLVVPSGTVPEREAWVNGKTAAERRQRDYHDSMRQVALESVRSRRAQISALQSILAGHRAEAEFARTGPEL